MDSLFSSTLDTGAPLHSKKIKENKHNPRYLFSAVAKFQKIKHQQALTFPKKIDFEVKYTLISPSRILRFCNRWIYRKIKQTPQFSQELANFRNCCRFSTDFGLRCIPWRHRNAHSVKERLFLSLKNGMNSLAFSSWPIYKSYIGQTNRKQNVSALLVSAQTVICSDRSR